MSFDIVRWIVSRRQWWLVPVVALLLVLPLSAAATLPYFNDTSTIIHTKVTIPAGYIINLTINTTGGYAPDGNSVFTFFDDFDDASLNTSKWDCGIGSCTESGGYVSIPGEGWLTTDDEFAAQYSFVTRSLNSVITSNYVFGWQPASGNRFDMARFSTNTGLYYAGTFGACATGYSTSFTRSEMFRNGTTSGLQYTDDTEQCTGNPNTANSTMVGWYAYSGGGTFTVDWAYIKQRAATEPVVNVSGAGPWTVQAYSAAGVTDYPIRIPGLSSTDSLAIAETTSGGGGNATTYFALTAHDNVTAAALTSFNATICGSAYTTTNGTIQTAINQSVGTLCDISADANLHLTGYAWSVNTSTDYDIGLYPWTAITALDRYDNTSITTFTIENDGANYSTTNGTAYIPASTDPYDFTFYATNYFNLTYNTLTRNSSYVARPYQAWLILNATEIISGDAISDWTLRDPATGQTTYGTNPYLYLKAGSYNLTFNKTGWYDKTAEFSVAALDNTTDTFTDVYRTLLNITAVNGISGASITSFSLFFNSSTYSYTDSASTTNGSIIIPWIDEDSDLNLSFSSSGYANTTHLIDVNGTGIQNYTITVYTAESVLLKIFDEQNQTLINDSTITIQLSGATNGSNYTTSNGTIYIDLLTPQEYLFTYFGDDYPVRTYYFYVTEDSTTQLNLYLLHNDSATSILHTVRRSDTSAAVQDAYLYLQRKNLTGFNYYTVEVCKTDGNGQCIMQSELISAIYNVLIVYNNATIYNSGDTEFAVTSKTWDVSLTSRVLTEFFTSAGLSYNLTYTNTSNTTGNFYYSYLDTNNILSTSCMIVSQRNYTETTVLDSTCASGTSGTINTSITLGGQETCAYTYFTTSDGTVYGVKSICVVNTSGDDYLGAQGLIYIVLPVLLAVILLFKYNPSIAVMAAGFVMFLTWMIGLLPTTVAVISLVIAVIMVIVLRNRT